MISTDQVQSLLSDGGTVVGDDGQKIGNVGQVFLDNQTGEPEWVTVKTGMFGGAESFVPLSEATAEGTELQVPYSKDMVKDAPRMENTESQLTQDQEAELYRYYGLGYSEVESDSGLPSSAGDASRRDTSSPTTDDAMTRSEERLDVGTERREAGKARLRKYVVTEEQTVNVPVTREEVRVEREPITEANRDQAMAGADVSEEEHEVTLHEERVVVKKETVPVERVRMDVDTVTEDQQVTEDVRKEQIETDTEITTDDQR